MTVMCNVYKYKLKYLSKIYIFGCNIHYIGVFLSTFFQWTGFFFFFFAKETLRYSVRIFMDSLESAALGYYF